ncbi:5-oxoprolinase subunit B family protein [Nocardia amamiensis]|uniref:5-oxoprolinase subunit B family protein n=1 Tax=Nocardia amamiensis TaxID=404578 RepID=UPI00082B9DAD|nr:carboxyltransferase domain-containing protein [Nocardia amamiensis]
MLTNEIDIREYGDSGLLLTPPGETAEARWEGADKLASALRQALPVGLVDVVATFEHAFISFDPLITDHETMRKAVRSLIDLVERPKAPTLSRYFEIPVVYGGEYGPDLADVGGQVGLSPTEVVHIHTGSAWTVRFCGAPVGAPFLNGPTLPAPVSRLPDPRTRVLPGSVGLSGPNTVIYPVVSPGGWRIIGRTPLRLFDMTDENLVWYRPGDRFRFVPVPATQWHMWADRLPKTSAETA